MMCNSCTLDAPRVDGAAVCGKCDERRRFSFSVNRWACVLRLFIATPEGALRVDNHILPVLFDEPATALTEAELFVRAHYVGLPLFNMLAGSIRFLNAHDTARREFRLCTDFSTLGSEKARVEVHMKIVDFGSATVLSPIAARVLPQQVLAVTPGVAE